MPYRNTPKAQKEKEQENMGDQALIQGRANLERAKFEEIWSSQYRTLTSLSGVLLYQTKIHFQFNQTFAICMSYPPTRKSPRQASKQTSIH
jgi:hypothetical protein